MSYNKNMFALLNENAILVIVHVYDNSDRSKTKSTKELTYKALKQQNIAVGDRVVVSMQDRTYVKTVRDIRPISELQDDGIEYKWVIAKVDASLYHQVVDKERQFNAQLLQMQRERDAEQLRKDIALRLGDDNAKALTALTHIDSTVIEGQATVVGALPGDTDSQE